MAKLFGTTQFVGYMGYQRMSDRKLKNVTHKKAGWFEKHSARR